MSSKLAVITHEKAMEENLFDTVPLHIVHMSSCRLETETPSLRKAIPVKGASLEKP
jgi:hypothetical protein